MTAIEDEARTVEVRTQERGRESWAISLTTETSTGGYTDTIRMTEAEARAVYAALGERLSVPPSDDEREALRRIIDEHWFHPVSWRCSCSWVHPQYGSRTLDPRYIQDHIADAILASDVWRNRRQGPITDEAVEAAMRAFHEHPGEGSRSAMRAALEAAERVRSAAPSTTEQKGE